MMDRRQTESEEMLEEKLSFLTVFGEALAHSSDLGPSMGYCGCFAGKMSAALRKRLETLSFPRHQTLLPIIFQVRSSFFAKADRRRHRVGSESQVKALRLVKGFAVPLTPSQIHLLARSPQVEYLTLDAPIHTARRNPDHSKTAEIFPVQEHRLESNEPLGVAVLDSLVPPSAVLPNGRVRMTLDFVSGRREQPLGPVQVLVAHGTDIVRLIALSAHRVCSSEIEVLALRVVDEEKGGSKSDLIRAIDWVIENRDNFSIRVAHLALGHPPHESHLQDPLCQAVRKMVEAGIVTVASAGAWNGDKAWKLGSPGIEPSVITAADGRDIGRKSVPSERPSRQEASRLETVFRPDIYVSTTGAGLAVAEVTGAVSGMLAVNPGLNPTLVKSILVSAARHGSDAAWLNAEAAVSLAAQIARSTDLDPPSAQASSV